MDVSVIIVSYNVKDLLKNCLDSIIKFTKDVEFEIIVVDNASSDDSAEMLKKYSPDSIGVQHDNFKFILSGENGGFAKANNLGIKQAKGKYILLLNPDTLLTENSIGRVFLWMEGHKDIAVASCQLVDFEQQISPTGGYFPTLKRLFFWAFFIDDVFKNIKSYHPKINEEEQDWVTGAFFFVRKEAIDKVGYLDENFFMYGEELEWCMRFKEAGYKIGYTSLTKIIHMERKSSGSLPRNAILGEFKGLKYIYAKHFPGSKQIVLGSLLDIAAFARIVFWLVRLKPEMAKIYIEALFL